MRGQSVWLGAYVIKRIPVRGSMNKVSDTCSATKSTCGFKATYARRNACRSTPQYQISAVLDLLLAVSQK
jgi:hypothetical protein